MEENVGTERKKKCSYCTFERYNLNREESQKGYLRGRPIHSAGSGRTFEEVYLRKQSDTRFCLIVDAADVKIERPVKFCPCCGRELMEYEQNGYSGAENKKNS